ncbi:MAG: sigma-54-dependent Fis family transcriptional regulator [Gammaproteobacteria bacterium PRO9]|nr:sigma-54-dependent Fis family transcriptional regulator [Gammaproteobacteria bacterium PRO9]
MKSRHPVLLVEDDATLREALAETLRLAGYGVVTAADGTEALDLLDDAAFSAVVTDYQMRPMDGFTLLTRIRELRPHLPVLLITAHGTIEHAVRCMLEGASDYLVKPFAAPVLVERLQKLIPAPSQSLHDVVIADPSTVELVTLAGRVAASDATVLISGESGTGKEVLARLLHRLSTRADGPFVAVNCAAIPENMLEALLFGHEKGAFTGAHESRPGKFEQAQGGTLLLDEISEMDIGLQAKLLRVLQEKEVDRIGSRAPVPLNVRVIATTNRDLRAEVAGGRFREDLYYRLSVFPLVAPPLRSRPADIIPLARHFLRQAGGDNRPAPVLADDAIAALTAHAWPGNVRELQNLLQRALILCSGGQVHARDLRFETPLADASAPIPGTGAPGTAACGGEPPPIPLLQENLHTVEGHLIVDVLRRAPSRQHAADWLGISPRTLRYKIARLRSDGIAIPRSRNHATEVTSP